MSAPNDLDSDQPGLRVSENGERVRIALSALVLCFSAYFAWESLDFRAIARHFPLAASLIAIVGSTVELAGSGRRVVHAQQRRKHAEADPGPRARSAGSVEASLGVAEHSLRTYVGGLMLLIWMIVAVVLGWLIGLPAGLAVAAVMFVRVAARRNWVFSVLSGVALALALWVLGEILGLRWPDSSLPSPF